jgi:membrane associated rhomboid family serine protease
MIPLKDDAPRYSTPYITYLLIGLNTAVFLLMWVGFPAPAQTVVNEFGFIPAKFTAFITGHHAVRIYGDAIPLTAESAILPAFTAMFMHASWLHLIFNMLFLWIFGDNVEDYLGHFVYLIFYFITGLAATALQTLLNPLSIVPNVGASGAIAGVMGGYLILFPSARVLTLVPLFVFITWIRLPAWLVLGYWFVVQFLSGAATAIAYSGQMSRGGVAFWAHVGGFGTGVLLIKLFPRRPRRYRFGRY